MWLNRNGRLFLLIFFRLVYWVVAKYVYCIHIYIRCKWCEVAYHATILKMFSPLFDNWNWMCVHKWIISREITKFSLTLTVIFSGYSLTFALYLDIHKNGTHCCDSQLSHNHIKFASLLKIDTTSHEWLQWDNRQTKFINVHF